MTTTHKPAASINQQPKKSVEQLALEAAKRLPAPVPGTVITVKLKVLPAYLNLHGIEPTKYHNHVLLVKKTDSPDPESENTESAENHE